jgi:hypothetical protein
MYLSVNPDPVEAFLATSHGRFMVGCTSMVVGLTLLLCPGRFLLGEDPHRKAFGPYQ